MSIVVLGPLEPSIYPLPFFACRVPAGFPRRRRIIWKDTFPWMSCSTCALRTFTW